MKIITVGRTVSFVVTLLSTIPLFVHYLMGTQPKSPVIVHIHVWFGLVFLILAITSIVLSKKGQNKHIIVK